jgi:FkbM family methyltransferase
MLTGGQGPQESLALGAATRDAVEYGVAMPRTTLWAKTLLRRALPNPTYRRIRQRRVARLIKNYQPWDRTGYYGGSKLVVHIADGLSEGWYGHDWGDPPEIAMLRQLKALRPGACVFDLGAHQGVVALMLAREVGLDGHVLAVEAEPHNARVAEQNVIVNKATNVSVIHAAISAHDGTTYFSEGLNGSVGTSKAGTVEVPAFTVDTLARVHRRPDVVFMDIEGYEGRALRCARRTIASGATFFVEIHVETLIDATADDIVTLFGDRDLYIGANPVGEQCTFIRYDGGQLPTHRFFLIAV